MYPCSILMAWGLLTQAVLSRRRQHGHVLRKDPEVVSAHLTHQQCLGHLESTFLTVGLWEKSHLCSLFLIEGYVPEQELM